MAVEAENTLREEVQRLRATLSDTVSSVPVKWRLTPMEERIFRVLLAVEIATRDAIAEATSVKSYRTQGVHLSRIRSKLTQHRVEIETVQSKGWRLVGREAWRSILSQPEAA